MIPRIHFEGLSLSIGGARSFTYQASANSRPRRKCRGCGETGGIVETVSRTNGGPQQQMIACRKCGRSETKELPR